MTTERECLWLSKKQKRRKRAGPILRNSSCIRRRLGLYPDFQFASPKTLRFFEQLDMFAVSGRLRSRSSAPRAITLITLPELCEQIGGMSRASSLAGAGRCRSRLLATRSRSGRTVAERRPRAPPAPSRIAACLRRFRRPASQPEFFSLDEAVGRWKAARRRGAATRRWSSCTHRRRAASGGPSPSEF